MKYLSCDKAGFMSLSCESTRVTYETSKRDGFVSYIWRCIMRDSVEGLARGRRADWMPQIPAYGNVGRSNCDQTSSCQTR